MRTGLLVTRIALAVAALTLAAFLHHGHIMMFITDVRALFAKVRLRGASIEQQSSRLIVRLRGSTTRYEVAVRRITRSLEVSATYEGDVAGADAWLAALSARSAAIRRSLGTDIDLERLSRTRARLVWRRVLTTDDWSPKRDLTAAVARQASAQLANMIEVVGQ